MTWVDGPMFSFDTETTGVNLEQDHILSAALINIPDTRAVQSSVEYLNWGIDIPAEAARVHGLTKQFLADNGHDPAEQLEAICQVLAAVLQPRDTPLVGMNLVFDLTMLDRNCRRVGVVPLIDRLHGSIWPVVDVFVLDKRVDTYRRGKRNLEALAGHYRLPWDQDRAHTAEWDALTAARLAWRLGRVWPRTLGGLSLDRLHDAQVGWKAEQDRSFAEYRRKRNESTEGLDGQWPIKMPI